MTDYHCEISRYDNFGFDPSTGGTWHICEIRGFVSFSPFTVSWVRPQVERLNRFSHLMAQITRSGAERCLLGIILLPKILRGTNSVGLAVSVGLVVSVLDNRANRIRNSARALADA
jgi:hypothetical protein